MTQIDLLVYHDKCSDGILAAWIVNKYCQVKNVLPLKAGGSINFVSNKTIYFVDVCPPLKNLLSLINSNNKIFIFDHHKSTFDDIKYNKNIKLFYDTDKSACQIVWDYFVGDERPWFVDYVADRDLWKWQLKDSKYVNLGMFFDGELCFEKYDKLLLVDDNYKNKLIEKGKLIEEIQNKELMMAKKHSVLAKFMDTNYIVSLGTCQHGLKSDLGNILVNTSYNGKYPDFAAIWNYDVINNEWWISLRGNDNSPDLSTIAKKLGGGGHMKSSCFTIRNAHLYDFFKVIK